MPIRPLLLLALFCAACARRDEPRQIAQVRSELSVVISTDQEFIAAGNDEGRAHIGAGQMERAATLQGLGTWGDTTALPVARYAGAVTQTPAFAYLLGGRDGSGAVIADAHVAPILAGGTLGAWAPVSALPAPRESHGAVTYDGFVFVLGGRDGSGALLTTILRAPLLADGTLGAWLDAGQPMPSPRMRFATFAARDRLYLAGGTDGTTPVASVYSAPIRADGTLGAFRAEVPLPAAAVGIPGAAHLGFAYLSGAFEGIGGATYYARVEADGTLSGWWSGPATATARRGHALLAANGRLYALGGCGTTEQPCSAPLAAVESSALSASGHPGPWVDEAPLPEGRSDLGGLARAGRLVVLGGSALGGNVSSAATTAPVDGTGSRRAWSTTTAMPASRQFHTMPFHQGFAYVVGGCTTDVSCSNPNQLATVHYAQVQPGGVLSGWTATTPLPNGRYGHSTVIARNDKMYVIGGKAGSQFRDDIQMARINADGTVGSWSWVGYVNAPRYRHASFVWQDYLYVVGGGNDTSAFSDIQRARFQANDWLDVFTQVGTLPGARRSLAVAFYRDAIYAIGGYDGSTEAAEVHVSRLDASGIPGPWELVATLPAGSRSHGASAHNGFLYVTGGYEGASGQVFDWFLSAPILADRTLGPWKQQTTRVPVVAHATEVFDGRLWISGGDIGSGFTDEVVSAPLRTDGSLGPWQAGATLPSARRELALVGSRDRLYAIGGGTGTAVADVLTASTTPAGTVSSWTATTPLPAPRRMHAAVSHRGWVYVAGGRDAANTFRPEVYVAQVSPDGTLGMWTETSPLPTGRDSLSLVAYGDSLYAIAGWGGDCLADVLVAPVQANGMLGGWTATSSIPIGIWGAAAFAHGGYLHVMGGWDCPTVFGKVETYTAPINADGTVGVWSRNVDLPLPLQYLAVGAADGFAYLWGGVGGVLTNGTWVTALHESGKFGGWKWLQTFSTARHKHGGTLHRGWLYLVGGYGSTDLADVQVSQALAPAARALYSRRVDLGSTASTLDTVTVNGGVGAGTVAFEYEVGPPGGVTYGPLSSKGTIPLGTAVALGDANVRHLRFALELDDSQAATATFGGVVREATDVIFVHGGGSGTPATQMAFVTGPQTVEAGACSGVATVESRDSGGNVANVTSDTAVSLTVSPTTGFGFYSDAACTTAVTSTTILSGASTASFYFRGTSAASFQVTASVAGFTTDAVQTETITGSTVASLELTGFPSPTIAGDTGTFVITARDAFGNRANYLGTVTLSSTDLQASLPSSYTFTADDAGQHTFTAVLRTAGLMAISATDSGASLTATQADIEVRPAAPTSLSVSGVPSPIETGTFADVTIRTLDSYDNLVPTYTGTVSFTSSDPLAELPLDTTFLVIDSGQKTITAALRFFTIGTHQVAATDIASPAITGAQTGIQVTERQPPLIVRDANLLAAVGVPYRFNALGRVTALGTGPITYSRCAGPPELSVEPATGSVVWTPTSAGDVAICVSAANGFGSDTYSFTVSVAASAPGPAPAASFTAVPAAGLAPLAVSLDGGASSGQGLMYLWDFGDDSPAPSGPVVTHTYPVAGGYTARLTVHDAYGRSANASKPIAVQSPDGATPPSARIVASATAGADSLTVDFSCDCRAGASPIATYHWGLGEGAVATTATAQRTYGPGRYHVQLVVVDSAGLAARDEVEIVVSSAGAEPPQCQAAAQPAAGPAALSTVWMATWATPHGLALQEWRFAPTDIVASPTVARTYDLAGEYRATLAVRDELDLGCEDTASVVVTGPAGSFAPRIISAPATTAQCGVPYAYLPSATGTSPMTWALGPGAAFGLEVDPTTGSVTWTPRSDQRGTHSIAVQVSNTAGLARQDFELEVVCGAPGEYQIVCGCGAAGATPMVLLALGVVISRTRRWRKARARR